MSQPSNIVSFRPTLSTVQIRYECGHRIMSVIDPRDYVGEKHRDEMSTQINPIVRDHCACPTCKAASGTA